MTKIHLAVFAALTLATACGPMTDSPSNCFLGPCGNFPPADFSVQIVGFPASRVSANAGHLAPGDTVRLVAVRVALHQSVCESTDTVHTDLKWGLTNGAAASVLVHPDGSARLTAQAAGKFGLILHYTGPGSVSYNPEPTTVVSCGAGGRIFSDIFVDP